MDTTKCNICLKRLNLAEQVSNKCPCGGFYCKRHFPEIKHDCTYDFREEHRLSLVKKNPIVKKRKVDKI